MAAPGRVTLRALPILLWASVTSLGFIAANAASLALAGRSMAVGVATAVLGAVQFDVAALVGITGGSGPPTMAFVMCSTPHWRCCHSWR